MLAVAQLPSIEMGKEQECLVTSSLASSSLAEATPLHDENAGERTPMALDGKGMTAWASATSSRWRRDRDRRGAVSLRGRQLVASAGRPSSRSRLLAHA